MQENNEKNKKSDFYGLGIAPDILQTLAKLDFKTPTPIQEQAIPVAIEGKDMIGIAQTGTGKTLAFGIPMVQAIMGSGGQGLVLLPTRELALQVEEVLYKIGRSFGIKTAVLIGGASMGPQIGAIRRNPNIIIATPGRLIDHLERGTIKLSGVRILVLDEADRMLDMGFKPQITRVLQGLPKQRQTMLFSATLPPEIVAIASSQMKLPVSIEITPPGTTIENVSQEIFIVDKNFKSQLLVHLLKEHRGSTLIFTKTKYGAARVAKGLRDLGESVIEIHSNRSLSQRRGALDGFRAGRFRVLVATDIASRGIDVKAIETVVNYDMPAKAEDYVHRIGRTGRAGMAGRAISFVTPEEQRDIRRIERLIRKNIPITSTPAGLPRASALAPRIASGGSRGGSTDRRRSRPPYRGGGNRDRNRQRRAPSSRGRR